MYRSIYKWVSAVIWNPGLVALFIVTAYNGTVRGQQECVEENVAVSSSSPVDGFVDVLQDADANGEPQGISQIEITFNTTTVDLTADCIDILTTGGEVPLVADVSKNGSVWTIVLDRPIPGGESTALVLWSGKVSIVLESHPGDVNFDRRTDGDDLTALNAAVIAGSNDLARYDINRNGTVEYSDVSRLQQILDATNGGTVWLTDKPQVYCCCTNGVCEIVLGSSCPQGGTSAGCPCVPNPCNAVPP